MTDERCLVACVRARSPSGLQSARVDRFGLCEVDVDGIAAVPGQLNTSEFHHDGLGAIDWRVRNAEFLVPVPPPLSPPQPVRPNAVVASNTQSPRKPACTDLFALPEMPQVGQSCPHVAERKRKQTRFKLNRMALGRAA
jgi:hypothetical protein